MNKISVQLLKPAVYGKPFRGVTTFEFPNPDGKRVSISKPRRYERVLYDNGDVVHVIELKRGQSW